MCQFKRLMARDLSANVDIILNAQLRHIGLTASRGSAKRLQTLTEAVAQELHVYEWVKRQGQASFVL